MLDLLPSATEPHLEDDETRSPLRFVVAGDLRTASFGRHSRSLQYGGSLQSRLFLVLMPERRIPEVPIDGFLQNEVTVSFARNSDYDDVLSLPCAAEDRGVAAW